MFKKISIIALLVLLAGAFVIYKYINQPHRNIQKEDATYTGQTNAFYSEFELNANEFNKKYLDKVIILEGEVTFIEKPSFELDGKVNCYLDTTIVFPDNLEIGNSVKIKGRYNGFVQDDLFGSYLNVDQIHFQ